MKKLILFFFTIVLIALLIIAYNHSFDKKVVSLNLSDTLETESINDINLSIYYKNPTTMTTVPWKIETLMTLCDYQITINGKQLEKHINSFKQLDNIPLEVIDSTDNSYVDCRVYYVLESSKSGKLFDVILFWAHPDSIIVNGKQVNSHAEFYNIIIPFLSDDIVTEYSKHI